MLFLNFAFWHEIFMFLLPRTGMAHLRSIFFFSVNNPKRYIPTVTFYSYWASRKRPKWGEGGWGTYKHIFILKIGVIKNIFPTKPSSF